MKQTFQKRDQDFWRALPSKTLFAVLDRPEDAAQAIQRLGRSGLTHDQIRLWRGPCAAAIVDPQQPDESWLTQLSRSWRRAGAVVAFRKKYASWIKRGKTAVAVKFKTRKDREIAQRVFERRGGRAVAYTENWTLTVCS